MLLETRIAATTKKATMAPTNRGRTSKALPIRSTSLAVAATTSPVATCLGRSAPRTAAWRTISCWTRDPAVIQLVTASRCRNSPAAAKKTQGQDHPGPAVRGSGVLV